MSLSLGGTIYNKLVVTYSYELALIGVLANSQGTHEISVGFNFGTNKKHNHSFRPSIFKTETLPSFYKWLDE